METLDDVLAHYGIKGMKWGVRRSEAQLARARGKKEAKRKKKEGPPPSEDAAKARESQTKAKKEGLATLSNRELQELNKRLNMEQQYRNLTRESQRKLTDEDKALIAAVINGASSLTLAATKANPMTAAVGTAITLASRPRSSGPAPKIEVLETRRN